MTLAVLYEGVAAQVDQEFRLTVSVAASVIPLVGADSSVRNSWLQTIQKDVEEYLMASVDRLDKNASAQAAQWSEQKSIDTSAMDAQTTQLDNLIGNLRSQAEINGTSLQVAIGTQTPMNKLLQSFVNLLGRGFN